MKAGRVALLSGFLAAASITACTTQTGGEPLGTSSTGATATKSTTSAPTSASSIPHRSPTSKNDGTTFDPCAAYGDNDLRGVGLDPTSIKEIDSTLLRGCKWYGAGWRVQITVLNGSVDHYLDQTQFPGAQPITIEGLNGATYRDEPGDMRSCYVELPSEKATVGIILAVSDPPALDQIPDACTKAVEVATLTAQKLPK
ncbi:hypothetical protein MSTE_00011 [Mycobacteroides stephanolepidis]|uniref:DUF3558 domain-containing protein n=1 Tax=[Mycobacterium] stephanolepidis TaxID=1520670 RepID=A0A1Z4EQY1_9MYCO|nr:DUF3558 domain-containing protein [[Mycobacterium] stephanolepidis]BAX95364.1 hypothetical protein MSTE_00011 [[Mycobacterium] stephanolepidis]